MFSLLRSGSLGKSIKHYPWSHVNTPLSVYTLQKLLIFAIVPLTIHVFWFFAYSFFSPTYVCVKCQHNINIQREIEQNVEDIASQTSSNNNITQIFWKSSSKFVEERFLEGKAHNYRLIYISIFIFDAVQCSIESSPVFHIFSFLHCIFYFFHGYSCLFAKRDRHRFLQYRRQQNLR